MTAPAPTVERSCAVCAKPSGDASVCHACVIEDEVAHIRRSDR